MTKELHRTPYILGTAEVAELYALRLLVLRPGGTLDDCHFEGDEDESTTHFSVTTMYGEVLAGVSFFEREHPKLLAQKPLQLRGMATHPDHRGMGYGAALIGHAKQIFTLYGFDLIWCNAREVAVPFYSKLGFGKLGEAFDIPGIGPHWLMHKPLNKKEHLL